MATAMLMLMPFLPVQAYFPQLKYLRMALFYLPLWMFYAMGDFYGRPIYAIFSICNRLRLWVMVVF